MKKEIIIYSILGLFFLGLISTFFIVIGKKTVTIPSAPPGIKTSPLVRDAIAIVNISGPITLSQWPRKMFSYDAETISHKLRNYSSRSEIKGILVRINSPGGSVAACQEIFSEIMRLKKLGKPVVASMGDLAASGGYYVASACSKIVANPGTLTGSIGVILELGNVQELFKKIGVKIETIKSGEHKDSGSPFRQLTLKEREMFQELVNDAYAQFIDAITAGRNMDKEKVINLADGSVYTGSQALELGLVDTLGNDLDAIDVLKQLAKISGEPRIIGEYEPWEQIISIFGQSQSVNPLDRLISKSKFRLEYMME
ncbi:MAG: signal peptide peptidase SppA [Elusimicrobiota bacterium]